MQALIRHEVERGIAHERIVLAGFSQGCAMALHTGLRLPQCLAGIVALSGYLPLADRIPSERHAANAHTQVFMAHGTEDPVVVLRRGEESRDALARPSISHGLLLARDDEIITFVSRNTFPFCQQNL